MKKRISVLIIVLVLLCSLVLTGCEIGSRSKNETAATGSYYYNDSVSMVADGDSYGGFEAQAMSVSAGSTKSAAADSMNSVPESGTENTDQNQDQDQDLDPEKIIYSGNVTLETVDFNASVTALEELISKIGGWVESSSVNGSSYSTLSRGGKSSRTANYTIRVPNDKFSMLMDQFSALGNIPYSAVYTENVSAQYYDTETRLKTCQAQETRLLELMVKAETVSDVIEIENALAEVRYSIESLQTSLRDWDRRVDWSTVYLTVKEVYEYTPEESVSYFSRMGDAVTNGIEILGDFFIELLEVLPVIIVVLVLLLVVILIFRAVLRKRPRKNRENK